MAKPSIASAKTLFTANVAEGCQEQVVTISIGLNRQTVRRRYAMKPIPKKPRIVIAQVEGSGTAATKVPEVKFCARALQVILVVLPRRFPDLDVLVQVELREPSKVSRSLASVR